MIYFLSRLILKHYSDPMYRYPHSVLHWLRSLGINQIGEAKPTAIDKLIEQISVNQSFNLNLGANWQRRSIVVRKMFINSLIAKCSTTSTGISEND